MYILQKKDKPRTAVQNIGPQTKYLLYIYGCIYCRKKISLVLPCKASTQTKYNVIRTTHIKITCIMVMSTRDWIPRADRTQRVSGRIIKLSNITSE